MDVSPAIASAMMAVPSDRMRYLTIAELDAFGIRVSSKSGAQR